MADTIVKRLGGKVRIRDWIIENIPPHHIFCEPFGGSFAVGIKIESPKLVYNDLDQHVYNFFKSLRDNDKSLIEKILYTPYSRQEYEHACKVMDDKSKPWLKIDPLEWARLYLIYNRQSFGGREDNTWAISRNGENMANSWNNMPSLMKDVAAKLKNAYIENSDYKEVFRRWDTPETCFYIDPPYENVEKDYYQVNKKDGFNHTVLADDIKKLQGSVVVSYYYSDAIVKMYPHFQLVSKSVTKHVQTKGVKDKAQEILLIKKSEWAKSQQSDLY